MFKHIGNYDVTNIASCVDSLKKEQWTKWRDLQELYKSGDSTMTYCLSWCMPGSGDVYKVVVHDNSSDLAKACEPLTNRLTDFYKSKPIAVGFNRLLERRNIPPHTDAMYEGIHRIHIPIRTNQLVFVMDGRNVLHHWRRGGVYQLDATKSHGIVNASRLDRVHLVIDIPSQQFIKPIEYEVKPSSL